MRINSVCSGLWLVFKMLLTCQLLLLLGAGAGAASGGGVVVFIQADKNRKNKNPRGIQILFSLAGSWENVSQTFYSGHNKNSTSNNGKHFSKYFYDLIGSFQHSRRWVGKVFCGLDEARGEGFWLALISSI